MPRRSVTCGGEFRTSLPATFVVYGGTTLALHTASRESEDFDFFTNEPVDAHTLSTTLPFLRGAELIQAAPATATCLVDRGGPVKVSYFDDGDLAELPDDVKTRLAEAASEVRAVDPVVLRSTRLL